MNSSWRWPPCHNHHLLAAAGALSLVTQLGDDELSPTSTHLALIPNDRIAQDTTHIHIWWRRTHRYSRQHTSASFSVFLSTETTEVTMLL
jgi:hypothetical protein